jgi:hypothetical protein
MEIRHVDVGWSIELKNTPQFHRTLPPRTNHPTHQDGIATEVQAQIETAGNSGEHGRASDSLDFTWNLGTLSVHDA